jgi:acetylglutamate kinase
MKDVIVVKIGGSTFGSGDTTVEDIVSLQRQGRPLVMVHGGGSMVTEWLERQGIATRFVRGERVTDAPTLEVVTAVLAGLANKTIVAAINSRGGWAVGISGVDGTLLRCRMKDKELGYVGIVEKVDPAPLEALLVAGFVPVISPLGLCSGSGSDDAPQLVNLNGDTVAGELAAALRAARLIFLTDVDGVKGRSGEVISKLSAGEAEALVASGVASGGMIPKVNACLRALGTRTITRIIDGRKPHALLKELEGKAGGTTIHK